MSQVALFRAELQQLDDTGPLQLAKLLGYAGEQLTQVHRVQPFGLSSNPPAGAHGIGLRLRGSSDLAAVLGLELPSFRPLNTEGGGTVVYDANGSVVSLVNAVLTIVHLKKLMLKVGSTVVSIVPGRINLGADPAPNAVMTTAGASTVVFAA
jgi:phage gp45-like